MFSLKEITDCIKNKNLEKALILLKLVDTKDLKNHG